MRVVLTVDLRAKTIRSVVAPVGHATWWAPPSNAILWRDGAPPDAGTHVRGACRPPPTSRDRRQIAHCLHESETAVGILAFEHWDGALHQAILAASQNHLLVDLDEAIKGVRRQPEWETVKRRSLTPERLARDGAAARSIVRDHLVEVRGAMINP